MCMAKDCIGFALDLHRFLMFFLCVCMCVAFPMLLMVGCVCVWQMIALVLHWVGVGF